MIRTGHQVVLEEATPANDFVRTLYLFGGYNDGTFLDDVWSWRLDIPDEPWRRDFTEDALFTTGDGETFRYSNNSPSIAYISPDSDLSLLQRYWVPTHPDSVTGERLELRPYLTSDKREMLNEVGIYTVRELADIDLYDVLKLRGFDYPSVPLEERYDFQDVCDFRALAIAVVSKCSLNPPLLYDGQTQRPPNIIPGIDYLLRYCIFYVISFFWMYLYY